MRRKIIVILGFLLCAVAYGAVYVASTSSARTLADGPAPELAWLRKEFSLPNAEFKRICELHAAYLPQCREMCERIDSNNTHLRELLSASGGAVTADIEQTLGESARLRAECQTMMLKHFYEVSRTMPQDEGRRYLAWVQEKAFGPMYAMHATNSPAK
jgi:hypothetical protein